MKKQTVAEWSKENKQSPKKAQSRTSKIIIADEKDDTPVYIKMEEQQQAEMIDRIKKRNERKIFEGCVSLSAPRKPYPLTKKIGLAVLVITETIVIGLFTWASVLKNIQSAFDAAGYQMIIFASFWGIKAVADNIKAVRGKE